MFPPNFFFELEVIIFTVQTPNLGSTSTDGRHLKNVLTRPRPIEDCPSFREPCQVDQSVGKNKVKQIKFGQAQISTVHTSVETCHPGTVETGSRLAIDFVCVNCEGTD